jgi:hypothetical protein
LLKITADSFFLKKKTFSAFFSVWIPPQVRLEKLRQISQHHGRIITTTTVSAFS